MDWEKHEHYPQYFLYLPVKGGEDVIIGTRSEISGDELASLFDAPHGSELEKQYSVIHPESHSIELCVTGLERTFSRSTTLDPSGNRIVSEKYIAGRAGKSKIVSGFATQSRSEELEFQIASSRRSITSFAVSFYSHDDDTEETEIIIDAYGPDRFDQSAKTHFGIRAYLGKSFFDDIFWNVREGSKIDLRLSPSQDREGEHSLRYLPNLFRRLNDPQILLYLEERDFVNSYELKKHLSESIHFGTEFSSLIEFTP